MAKYYRLNEDKNYIPCNVQQWAEQLEHMYHHNAKHVAKEIVDGKGISTVWLGLNHQFNHKLEDSHPLIFETMIEMGYNPRDIEPIDISNAH